MLTEPGLGGIVAAVKEGRMTFQRILTYTLNSITKKIVQVLFLAVGLIMTGHAILTPMLMVIIMITGDFLGMSLTTDNVRPSPTPNAWRIGKLTIAGVFMGIGELVFCTAVLAIGKFGLGFEIETLQNAGVRRHRVRQSGDDLYQSRTPAPVVLPPQPLARRFIGRRYSDRLGTGGHRHLDEAVADQARSGFTCSGGGLRVRPGVAESSGIHSAQDRLTRGGGSLLKRTRCSRIRFRWACNAASSSERRQGGSPGP